MAETAPLMLKFDQMRAEVAALFEELLAPGRLAARTRKKVLQVRDSLIAQGLIPEGPLEAGDKGEGEDDDPPFEDDFDFESPPFANDSGSEPRVAAAPQHGQAPGRDSLRTLFRRLVLALHPDRARHDLDRARRTEAMKEATRAYEDGDLARLLELEKSWEKGASVAGAADDTGQRCAELEQMIRELNRQSRELSRDLREVQQRASAEMLDVPPEQVVAMAENELNDLTAIRDFVKKFRDGRITLAEFMQGPELGDEDAVTIDLEALLEEMLQEAEPSRSRANTRTRRRRA